jgi:hypothetical protein
MTPKEMQYSWFFGYLSTFWEWSIQHSGGLDVEKYHVHIDFTFCCTCQTQGCRFMVFFVSEATWHQELIGWSLNNLYLYLFMDIMNQVHKLTEFTLCPWAYQPAKKVSAPLVCFQVKLLLAKFFACTHQEMHFPATGYLQVLLRILKRWVVAVITSSLVSYVCQVDCTMSLRYLCVSSEAWYLRDARSPFYPSCQQKLQVHSQDQYLDSETFFCWHVSSIVSKPMYTVTQILWSVCLSNGFRKKTPNLDW